MANPILTDKAFEKATAAASGADVTLLPPPAPGTQAQPMDDGPISPYRAYKPMTLDGTIAISGFLFVLLLAAAVWGWNQVEVTRGTGHRLPDLEPDRRAHRLRRRAPRLVQADAGQVPGPGLRPRRRRLRRRHLGGVQRRVGRHRRPGRRRHPRRVPGHALPVPGPDREGHRQVPQRRHRRHRRAGRVLPPRPGAQPVREEHLLPRRPGTTRCSASASACWPPAWPR